MDNRVYVIYTHHGGVVGRATNGGVERIFKTRESANAYIDEKRNEYKHNDQITLVYEHWHKGEFYFVRYITNDENKRTVYIEYEIYDYELED